MKHEIIDNFIHPNEFQKLQILMLGEDLPWYFMDNIDYLDDEDKFQFTHNFYDQDNGGAGPEIFDFIFKELKPKELSRIKANLIPRTAKIQIGRFHTDQNLRRFAKGQTTSILYMNSNNGYTEFEDGTKVESVANRFLTFPTQMQHRGTSCTDKKVRIVINFNYLME